MLKIIIFLSTLFLCSILSFSQNPVIEWENNFGGGLGEDEARDVIQTPDGGYIVVGHVNGGVWGHHGQDDYWVSKLSSDGDTIWTKCYGGGKNDQARSVQLITGGGYIVAGGTKSKYGDVWGNHSITGMDFWIIWLDADGDTLWTKCYGGIASQFAEAIENTDDGGYIIAGRAYYNEGDVWGWHDPGVYTYDDFWVVKINAGGDTLWTRCYGGYHTDRAYDVKQTTDGGYIVAGSTLSVDGDVTGHHGGTDMWIVKTGPAGNILWARCYGGSGADEAHHIIQTNDGGYLVAGFTRSTDGDVWGNHGGDDFWILKLNSDGDTTWARCYGGGNDDKAYSVQQTSDGGYIVAGETGGGGGDVVGHHGPVNIPDYWIIKLEPNGDIAWTQCIGISTIERAYSIKETSDEGYIIAGERHHNISISDHYVVKLCTQNHIIITSNTIHDGEDEFWSASETITIPEPAGSFIIENGGSVELKAGEKITIKPFFNAQQGSHLWAHIGFVTCPPAPPPTVVSAGEIGIKENAINPNEKIHFFPNPTTGEINIYFSPEIHGEKIQIELYNLIGDLILNKSAIASGGLKLDISSLSGGLYIIKTTLNANVSVDKIVKN